MDGEDEVVEILDYPNAEITENYILLTAQPSDWKKNSTAYFFQDDNDKFKEVEEVEVEYKLQKIQPYDWAVNFSECEKWKHVQECRRADSKAASDVTAFWLEHKVRRLFHKKRKQLHIRKRRREDNVQKAGEETFWLVKELQKLFWILQRWSNEQIPERQWNHKIQVCIADTETDRLGGQLHILLQEEEKGRIWKCQQNEEEKGSGMESKDILHQDFLRSTASLEGKPLLHRSQYDQRSGMEREQILHAEW